MGEAASSQGLLILIREGDQRPDTDIAAELANGKLEPDPFANQKAADSGRHSDALGRSGKSRARIIRIKRARLRRFCLYVVTPFEAGCVRPSTEV